METAKDHQLLTPRMSTTFLRSQMFESKQLTNDTLHDNDDYTGFYQHLWFFGI